MSFRKIGTISAAVSGILLLLMIVFRHADSELFTFLSVSLGGTVFFTLLYYLYSTERIQTKDSLVKYTYIFLGITIPVLIYGVEVTREDESFIHHAVRVLLAIEVSYFIFLLFFRKWKEYKTLKSEKIQAELSLLKEQINPHFFFNTLNNLYALIKSDPNLAQDYVLKLSDLMQFTIYESGKDCVLLKDEISYLLNYIELQTARYYKAIDVDFTQEISNRNAKIPPLMCIVLLENAFKHGVEHQIDQAFVHIHIEEDKNRFLFVVKNGFDENSPSESKGIGLQNLRNRLQVLYPNTHLLTSSKENGIYKATLEIRKND